MAKGEVDLVWSASRSLDAIRQVDSVQRRIGLLCVVMPNEGGWS